MRPPSTAHQPCRFLKKARQKLHSGRNESFVPFPSIVNRSRFSALVCGTSRAPSPTMDPKFCKYKLVFPHSLRSSAGENKIPRQARDDVSGDVVETFILFLKPISFVILSEASAESKDLNFERTNCFSLIPCARWREANCLPYE